MSIQPYPYWWEAARPPESRDVVLPTSTDVVIIGAGYTGLSAALTLARAGREVLVLDAENPGSAASSRNAGYFGYELRASLSVLMARFGRATALEVARAGLEAFAYSKSLIEREQIRCDLADVGRLLCAHRPSHYEAMAREAELVKKELGVEYQMLSPAELREQIGTEIYHGAKLLVSSYAMHPGKYLCGLLDRVRNAGVTIAGNTPAIAMNAAPKEVATPRGKVSAHHIIVATNGYSGDLTPGLKRRLVPLRAQAIATEELPDELMRKVFRVPRVAIDTRKLYRAFRPSPDGKRILFIGRPRVSTTDAAANAAPLREDMVGLFPALRDVAITHSWGGYVAYTFDKLPHLGEHDGIHYAMGYNGAGATMGPFLGHKIALKIMQAEGADCLFVRFEMQSRPLYSGNPWFLPLVVAGYRFIDRFGR